jgi:hypothetical protein
LAGVAGGAAALPPPHPIAPAIKVAISSRPSGVIVLRRRMGNPNQSSDAMATTVPPIAHATDRLWAAADAAVVLTVSVAVTGALPVAAGGAETEHVGASAAPMGPPETAQLRATLPVKPPVGVIVMVDVPVGPGDAMVTAVLLSVKPGGAGGALAGTLTVKLVVALRLPVEAAVTVTM